MNIYIARHAWAHERDSDRWPDDSLRELTADGASRYASMVKTLAKRGFAPDRIATSPFVRCLETASIIADLSPGEPEVDVIDALEPGSDFAAICDWSEAQEVESVCWVGHAPDVGDLTSAIIGDLDATIRFAKGAVAACRCDGAIGVGRGELRWFVTAKVLGV